MTVFQDFKSASIWGKLSLVFLTIASIFGFISFATTGWGSSRNIVTSVTTYTGLWRICQDTNQVGGCQQTDGWANDWYGAVQAMVIFGVFGILISLCLVVLFLFFKKCQRNGELGLAAGIICIITSLLYLIGCIVFGTQWDKYYKDTPGTDYSLEYGFALSIVALVLEFVAGIFLIAQAKRGETSSSS